MAEPAAARVVLRRLALVDFRSYSSLDLALDAGLVVFVGDNGAGKTNLLEALSLLGLGRGLRRADPTTLARAGGAGGWAVSADLVEEGARARHLGTGVEAAETPRRFRIDRAPVSSGRQLADHVRVTWLTPAMDGLFVGAPADRRRFLDRLVLALDADHGARVNALDRSLRNRNRILEEGRTSGRLDRTWAEAAEREVATAGVAVALARTAALASLTAEIESGREPASPFPHAALALEGAVEALVAAHDPEEATERYRTTLREARVRDAAAGRTLVGPHVADLAVRHGPKDIPAALASTGEQKALLVGLVLAHARLVARSSGLTPLVLLDEIAAHFDPLRRTALFEDLAGMSAQVFMTGADAAAFADVRHAQRVCVTPGTVGPG